LPNPSPTRPSRPLWTSSASGKSESRGPQSKDEPQGCKGRIELCRKKKRITGLLFTVVACLRFAIREGGRTVGSGVVTKVLK
jgi:hypothetical protein